MTHVWALSGLCLDLFGVWVARETSCAAMHCFTQGHSVTSCAPARPVFMWNTVERCSMLTFLVFLSSSCRVFPTLEVRAFGALQNMLEQARVADYWKQFIMVDSSVHCFSFWLTAIRF